MTELALQNPAPRRSPAVFVLVFVAVSLGVHAGVLGALALIPARVLPKAREPVQMQIIAAKPKPAAPEVEKPKPAKVKPPPVRVAKVDRPPPPVDRAPPPPNQTPPPDAKPAPVVIGLTLSSTSTAGNFAAPLGNSVYGKTERVAQAPGSVKAYAAKHYVPSYQLDSPPEKVTEIKVPYPPQAKLDQVEGAVLCKVSIDEAGKVTAVKVLEGPGHGLNEVAREALMRFTFKPAIKGGEPVATDITYRFTFLLPEG